MKFYDFARAPSPRRARIFMAEKGLDVEIIQVDLGAEEQRGEAFTAINPRQTVPALVLEEGVVLTDNASIARYLEETCPEPPLLGRDPIEKALVAEWTARVESEGLMAIAEVLRNTSSFFKKRSLTGPRDYEQIPALAERGAARIEAFYEVLDTRLQETPYLAGEAFSAADIAALVCCDFAGWVKMGPPETFKALATWRDAVNARPSSSA